MSSCPKEIVDECICMMLRELCRQASDVMPFNILACICIMGACHMQ